MGFQFIRDSEPNGMGHNSQFSDYISQYMFTKLTDSQMRILNAIQADAEYVNNTKYVLTLRQDMSSSLRKLLESPSNLSRLNMSAVVDVYGTMQRVNGQIILRRAKALGSIVRSMSADLLNSCNQQLLFIQLLI